MLRNSTKIAPDDESPPINEVIGKVTDVPVDTKKTFEVRGRKILVINDNGEFYAINGLCSHYNYPLENGVYSKGKIRCPYHGACFNVKTGDIEDYPGFDNLHSFEVIWDILLRSHKIYNLFRNPLSSELIFVIAINPVKRTVSLSSGNHLRYSKLVLAVGCTTRKLKIPGSELENVFTLRVIEEANMIASQSIGKHVVCIGGSFIGMEIASALYTSAASVTIICTSDEPIPALGKDIGAAIRKRFESKGVSVLVNAHVERLEGIKAVSSVILNEGLTIQADVVVAGIGVTPSTEWLKNSCINLDTRGFIKVDSHFRTSADWIYAIGDAVTVPLPLWDIESINIQHFQTAQTHGQLLGYSITGKPQPHPIVPFFWTVFFLEFGIRFAGCTDGFSETIIHGNIDEMNFSKYYLKNNVVVAVANAGPLPTAIQFLTIFQQNIKITRTEVEKISCTSFTSVMQERNPRGNSHSEKERYRTCCDVCHIKFGTVFLGTIEAIVCVFVLIGAVQQTMWKNQQYSQCDKNFLRDCLIFQFSHFNVTLIFDYIVIIMMAFILLSVGYSFQNI
uniref:Rieske domain-containing protein n=1 Tax=Heterorhabditis bacteriophora TaxID=37862 RepID=A0A1I7XM63_HETBA